MLKLKRLVRIISSGLLIGLLCVNATPAQAIVVSEPPASEASTGSKRVKGRVIVKLKSAPAGASDSLEQVHRRVKARGMRPLLKKQSRVDRVNAKFPNRARRAARNAQVPDTTNVYIVDVPEDADVESVARQYREDPNVEYAQPDYEMQALFTPNDPYYSTTGSWGQAYDDLWGLKKMQLGSAWDFAQGQGIVVAVVDSGIDYTHPDLAANVWTNAGEIAGNGVDDDDNGFIDDVRGWDFANDDNDPMDDHGHGTHVAGTVAAVGNNGVGIVGVASQAKIMGLKGLAAVGGGTSADLAEALIYAAENGADVINNSWGCAGGCLSNPVVEDAVRTAHGLGAVVVFSAGNDAQDVLYYSPQNMNDPKPVVVSASTEVDATSSFSNLGYLVDVAAPGSGTNSSPPAYEPFRNILSLKASLAGAGVTGPNGELVVGGQYLRQAGTSMAAPHASGLAALILAYHPTFSNEEVRQALRASTDDIGAAGLDRAGTGRLNAASALGLSTVLDVSITTPTSGETVSQQAENLAIQGTATGPGFQQYALSYQPYLSEGSWLPIGSPVSTPVVDATLGTWPIGQLANGTYALKLAAQTTGGKEFQAITIVNFERYAAVPVAQSPFNQTRPAVSGTKVVWEDRRNGVDYDVYLYDLATDTEQLIAGGPMNQRNPRISGNWVVWEDWRNAAPNVNNADIYAYDLTTGTEQPVTTAASNQMYPDISGSRVVYEDAPSHGIYLYDLSAGTSQFLGGGPVARTKPAISGTRVVYEDRGRGGSVASNVDVYLYDVATGVEQPIATGATSQQRSPSISGSRVVWEDTRDGQSEIYAYDVTTSTEQRLTTEPAMQWNPQVSGDIVVFEDFRNGFNNPDIYFHDLLTGTQESISLNLSQQTQPAIDGGRIVWQDDRNGDADVYLSELDLSALPGPPVLAPLANQSITAGKLLVLPVKATDRNNQLLTFSAPQKPNGSLFLPKGDVSQNGVLDQADVNTLSACVAGTQTCTMVQVKLGDVAGPSGYVPDGALTTLDVQTVQAMLVERANPGQDLAVLDLVNTFLFLWQTAIAYTDADPYTASFQVIDGQGGMDAASTQITVTPNPAAAVNVLSNGGFEQGESDWSVWTINKQHTTETSYTGTASAKLTLGPLAVRRLSHADITVTAGAIYRAFTAVKTSGVTSGRGYVELKWKKSGGMTVRTDVLGITSGTTGWIRYMSANYTVPTGAVKVEVSIVTDPGAGTAYFDAVRLERLP